jgi:mannan endo-1,4-beta-mannosidase
LRNDGIFSLEERRAMIRGWLRCARRTGLAGAGLWMFAYDARPDAWDRHTFYFRDGTEPGDPLNRYADLVAEAAER